jgi:hypothetical protein
MVKVKRYIKIILAYTLGYLLKPLVWLKRRIIKALLRLRAKLQIGSLREAIVDADKDKAKTGRKNMVVFNTTSGKYEPLQKKLLKTASKAGKNKSNKAMTEGRIKMMKQQKVKPRLFDSDRVHQIEKKSLYITN